MANTRLNFPSRCKGCGRLALLFWMLAVWPGCSYYIIRDGEVNQARVAEVKRQVQELRGLEFTHEVKVAVINQENLEAYLEQELEESFPRDTFTHLESASVNLGLLPVGMNLKESCTRLFITQVCGFYNFRTQELYLTSHARERSFWVKLIEFIKQRDLIGEFLISHELTHALQDQHFNLRQTYENAYLNFDRTLAVAALVEGDAMLVSMEVLYAHLGPAHFRTAEQKFRAARQTITNIRVSEKRMEQLKQIPGFVRQVVIFPYTYGLDFTARLYLMGGWQAVNKALESPPESTEQVLHPEKFLSPRDKPRKLTIKQTLPPSEWRLLASNTVGELGIRCLFEQYLTADQAESIAYGWGGDLLQLYQHKKQDKLGILWHTAWDSQQDAGQFARGLKPAFCAAFPELGSWRQQATETANNSFVCYQAHGSGQEVKISVAGDEVKVFIISGAALTGSIVGEH